MKGRFAPWTLVLLLSAGAGAAPPLEKLAVAELSETEAIRHALDRLGFGPRPEDEARVRREGLAKHIERQLQPAKKRDGALEARLSRYSTLNMSQAALMAKYPNPAQAVKLGLSSMEEADRTRAKIRELHGESSTDFALDALSVVELALAKVTRAVYSERQLDELMADFWFNHFNVYAGKYHNRWLLPSYERDALRPRAMGKFADLLQASARSPAMLFYLDNWMSTGASRPMSPAASAMMESRPSMLNENYARELLELHTLGVDGGYTQRDVVEVARCFTGWTLRAPHESPEFYFDEKLHDPDPKTVLGVEITAGGIKDGEKVIEILARHPSTARFISTKLARRFVADDPPAALVERMAAVFLESDGDIRRTLRAMIHSPEFWSRSAYRSKIKRPLEFAASAARALGAEAESPMSLLDWTARMGEPLYYCESPAGFADRAAAWVNAGGLMSRMGFAAALPASAGLLVGSPEFQRK